MHTINPLSGTDKSGIELGTSVPEDHFPTNNFLRYFLGKTLGELPSYRALFN